jgi:hypothetical protein
MLLALRNEQGTIAAGSMYLLALGGGILAELVLAKRVALEKERKKQYARVENAARIGEPVLDECLEKLRTAKRRATLQTWVSRFAHVKHLKHRVAEGLCRRGILRADEDAILLLFRRRVYPEVNPRPERRVIERLHKAIFTETNQVAPRTVVLASLAHSTGLLKTVFDKKDMKGRETRIKSLTNGEVIGKAAKEAIEAVQAAVVVAAVMPAVMAASASSH